MAETKFSSAPGPTELRNAGLNAGNTTTAFQSVSAGILAGTIGANRYSDPNNMYLQYLYASDGYTKDQAFQNIFRGLASQAAPAGSAYGTMWEHVQSLMRKAGISKGDTPIGVPSTQDMTGLESVIRGAIGSNASDPIAWLQIAATTAGGKKITQPDTTPKFNRQVVKTLQYKDYNDAKNAFYDLYFTSWGSAPTDDVITKFQNAWNAESKAQAPTTTTATKTTYKPIIDPKTKKQVKNKEGILQYEAVNTISTESTGEGFTADEQKQFLGDFLKANYPTFRMDSQTIGGAAKTIYDEIVSVHKDNYDNVPTFDKIMPTILNMVGSSNPEVAAEYLRQYKDNVRKNASSKFMSLAEDFADGKDAREYVDGLIETVSQSLETTVDIDDPVIKRLLNFKDDKGNFRKANSLEISDLLLNDPRQKFTSRAINESVNLFESLKNKLGR